MDLKTTKMADLLPPAVPVNELAGRKLREEPFHYLAAVFDSSDDAIICKDLNGVITSWNLGATRIFGYTAEEAIGKSVTMLIPEDHADEEPEILGRIRRGERISHYETIRRRKDGSLINLSLTVSPIKDEEGTVIGASKVGRDITERTLTEQRLVESFEREKLARLEAEAAVRTKDQFLAAVSHELRTPLNPILLLAGEEAQNPRLPAEVRQKFEIIRKHVEVESRLIDDLLDLTRLNYGKLQFDRQMVDTHAVLRESFQSVQSQTESRRLQVEFHLQAQQSMVSGDPIRLQQIFWNLLANAVKFTPEGGKITVQSENRFDRIFFQISDTGLGMTPLELGRIFKPFSQGDHAGETSFRYGGLGLGLAIVKMLVEFHGGEIHAASDGRHHGATFVMELPTAAQGNPPSPTETTFRPSAKPANTRILLVEDHEPTRNVIIQLLIRRHYQVVSARSLGEARALAELEQFDFVISDIGLPDGSGFDLMAEFHHQYALKGIALTGYGLEEDIERSRQAGFVVHLTKPVGIRSLEEALALF